MIGSNLTNQVYDRYFDWSENKLENVETMKFLITGQKQFEPDTLPQKIKDMLKTLPIHSILDYGAGLGRNLPLLLQTSDNVDYIDLLKYKEKFEKEVNELSYKEKYYIGENYLPDMLDKKYDLIYASVVLQHIVDNEVYEKIVKILAEKTTYLLILQNGYPIKPILHSYFDFMERDVDNVTFINNTHTCYLYKSKL